MSKMGVFVLNILLNPFIFTLALFFILYLIFIVYEAIYPVKKPQCFLFNYRLGKWSYRKGNNKGFQL